MEVLFVSRSTQVYYDYPLHHHGYWELIVSLSGSGRVRIGDELYDFDESTVLCIPPWTPHCKKSAGGFTDGCIFIKNMTPPWGGDTYLFEDAGGSLRSLFLLAYETQMKGESNASQVIGSLVDAIYQILVGMGEAKSQRRSDAVARFQSILLENVSNCEFDITAELQRTGYSGSYFRKLFKAELGSSPVDYFNRLRIEHAKRQLRQYHDVRSIREIAESSGFSDPYYFSRTFRRHTGVSPRQYVNELSEFDFELLVESLGSAEDPEERLRREP